jgi:hypothetical protein
MTEVDALMEIAKAIDTLSHVAVAMLLAMWWSLVIRALSPNKK